MKFGGEPRGLEFDEDGTLNPAIFELDRSAVAPDCWRGQDPRVRLFAGLELGLFLRNSLEVQNGGSNTRLHPQKLLSRC